MSNLYSLLAGIGLGLIIFGASLFFSQHTNDSYDYNDNDNERKKRVKRCFKCQEDFPSLITFLCGHAVHESCFYDSLFACKVSDLKKYRCQICSASISYSLIKKILSTRCCVCKKEFGSDTYSLPSCGHKLHKNCLEADKLRHSINEKIMYKCPYSLLECNNEINLDRISNL